MKPIDKFSINRGSFSQSPYNLKTQGRAQEKNETRLPIKGITEKERPSGKILWSQDHVGRSSLFPVMNIGDNSYPIAVRWCMINIFEGERNEESPWFVSDAGAYCRRNVCRRNTG
jgi:hypothetical protein